MTNAQLARREERAANEPIVIQRIGDEFRVYAAGEPKNRYMVSGSLEAPQCTCPDFQYHRNDPTARCKHILAVLNEFSDIEVVAQNTDTYEAEERKAIQEESQTPRRRKTNGKTGNGTDGPSGGSQLLLKRSVSPDGRIDSLSVELSVPVDGLAADDIRARANRMLQLQSGVVAEFLNRKEASNGGNGQHRRNGAVIQQTPQPMQQASSNGQPAARAGNGSATVPAVSAATPARLVDVAGMQGKWGRRLYLNVEVNGRSMRLFGKADELVQHIRAAGYIAPEPFCEGAVLDIPCAVVTKPSRDGRYTDIEKVLPANGQQSVRRLEQ